MQQRHVWETILKHSIYRSGAFGYIHSFLLSRVWVKQILCVILAFSETAVKISIILKRTFLTYVWDGEQNEKKSNERTRRWQSTSLAKPSHRFTLPFLRKTLQSPLTESNCLLSSTGAIHCGETAWDIYSHCLKLANSRCLLEDNFIFFEIYIFQSVVFLVFLSIKFIS